MSRYVRTWLVTPAAMRIARDKNDFEDLFERAFPPPQERLPLVIENLDTE